MAADQVGRSGEDLVEVRLPSGRWIALRGADLDRSNGEVDDDIGHVEDVMGRRLRFATITSTLQEVGGLVRDALRPLHPQEAEVEIGVGLSAKTGKVLVAFGEAAAETSVKVTLRWRFDKADDTDGAVDADGEQEGGTVHADDA